MALPTDIHPFVQFAGAGVDEGDLGKTINYSLKFANTGFLKRNQLSSGDGLLANNRTFTFSTWFKHGNMGETNIFGIHPDSGNDNWLLTWGNFSNPGFAGRDASSGWMQYSSSPISFRDPNAWYHLFLTCSSGVLSLRVNNILQDQTSTQNHSMDRAFILGAEGNNGSTKMTAYLAETYFFQGSVLDAVNNHFIRPNEDGIWVPDTPTKTNGDPFTAADYGTNGWHLTYDPAGKAGESGDGAGIGADHSPNNNHFTASGFTTAAISSSQLDNDTPYTDTPTTNVCVYNPLIDAGDSGKAITMQNANITQAFDGTSTLTATVWEGDLPDGLVVYEHFMVGTKNGTGLMPILTAHYKNGSTQEIANGEFTDETSNLIGMMFVVDTINGAVYRFDHSSSASTWIDGNAANQTNAKVNGGNSNAVADFNQAVSNVDFYRMTARYGASHNTEQNIINFGQKPFLAPNQVPDGAVHVQASKLPPTIKNGKDYFDAVTYNGSTGDTSVTGLLFQPDFVWIKRRNANSTSHILANSLVGENKGVHSNSNQTEFDDNTTVKSFDSNGFTCGGNSQASENGGTFVAWCWKCNSTFTPTTSNITTPAGKRNRTAGFSMLTYTGSNGNGSITHGLAEAPEFIMFKRRSVADNWVVYHKSVGATKALQLDDSSGSNGQQAPFTSSFLQNTAPTNTTITLDGTSGVNGTGTYIAWCWHSVEGYSKIGQYNGVGNSTMDGTYVFLGFKPAFIMYKRTDQSGPWIIADSTRAPQNPHQADLFPNTSGQENAGTDQYLDLLSNGFKHRNTSVDRNSDSSSTYLYIAFAEHPWGGTNVPPATAR